MRNDPRQLDLFAPPPAPPKPPPEDDPLVTELLEKGIEHSAYLLDMNRTIGGWGTHENPSRLFQFPVEFVAAGRYRDDRGARLLLNHPLIGEVHPYVKGVEEKLGQPIEWNPVDEFGRPRDRYAYFHAIDLMTRDRLPLLRETSQFTEKACIAAGVNFALRYKGSDFDADLAREVMREWGWDEPKARTPAAILKFVRPDPFWNPESKSLQFGMNEGWTSGDSRSRAATVWAFVHGIEKGWFGYKGKGGHITMTPAGIEALGVVIPPKPASLDKPVAKKKRRRAEDEDDAE